MIYGPLLLAQVFQHDNVTSMPNQSEKRRMTTATRVADGLWVTLTQRDA